MPSPGLLIVHAYRSAEIEVKKRSLDGQRVVLLAEASVFRAGQLQHGRSLQLVLSNSVWTAGAAVTPADQYGAEARRPSPVTPAPSFTANSQIYAAGASGSTFYLRANIRVTDIGWPTVVTGIPDHGPVWGPHRGGAAGMGAVELPHAVLLRPATPQHRALRPAGPSERAPSPAARATTR